MKENEFITFNQKIYVIKIKIAHNHFNLHFVGANITIICKYIIIFISHFESIYIFHLDLTTDNYINKCSLLQDL